MLLQVLFGEFRSKDTAYQCIQKLGQHGLMDVGFFQIGDKPAQGMDQLSNAYAAELPHWARGILGSDIAIEGTTNAKLYDKEEARKIMGGDTKPDNAYAISVTVTDPGKLKLAREILKQHGADVWSRQLELEE